MFHWLRGKGREVIGHWGMELVIVIAGVLIALWTQQWTEQRGAIREMRSAEASLRAELRSSLTNLINRRRISNCQFERAKLIQSRLLAAGDEWQPISESAVIKATPGGRFGAPGVVPSVYQRPLDQYSSAAWTSALATGVLSPMSRSRFAQLVSIYEQVRLLQQVQLNESEAARQLSPLGNAIRLTPDMRAEMLRAVYELDRTRFTFNLIGPEDFAARMVDLGWNDRAEVERWIAADAADDRANKIVWKACVTPALNPFAQANR